MTSDPDHPSRDAESLLATLIQQLAGSSALREELERSLEQIIAFGTSIDSAVIIRTDTAGAPEVIAGVGSEREGLIRAAADSSGGGNEIRLLSLPLRERTGLLALSKRSELSPDENRLWETAASLFAMAISQCEPLLAHDGDARERLRSEVMATLSHELRTPLSTIKGYATALMLDEVDWEPEERREFLQLIDEECNNMQMMIGDLMDSALIDAGQMRIELEPVRLPLLVEEIVHEIQSHSDQHHFAVNFPTRFPILLADPMRIKQVLRNILDNAVKYSPNGGLIVVGGEIRSQGAVISITDSGIGISPEHLNSLFEKYFRVQSPTGYHVAGTGLGLPLARAIVEAHGGQIWAESRVGHGTTISFTLPLYDVESSVKGGS